jgi:DNA-binding transcriptional MerR regulator
MDRKNDKTHNFKSALEKERRTFLAKQSRFNLATQGEPPCNQVKELARNHLREIDDKIRELESLRNELRTLVRRKAGRAHENKVCPLIQVD